MIRPIQIVPLAPKSPAPDMMARLASSLSALGAPATVAAEPYDISFAYDSYRSQYHSTAVLARLAQDCHPDSRILLGVTGADLFVPVLTFVFGEAQYPGCAAVVSTYRLQEEFYGMPPDPGRLDERILKEALHELGHTQGLRHCDDWQCVMVSSHSVEKLDLKRSGFCPGCVERYRSGLVQPIARKG